MIADTSVSEVGEPVKLQVPARLAKNIGFLLGKAAQQILEMAGDVFSKHDIQAKHYGVMCLLDEYPHLSQVKISKQLLIDRTTVVMLVDELEAKQMVKRQRDPNDRRAHAVTLTAKGEETLLVVEKNILEVDDHYLRALQAHERVQLAELLLKTISW